MKLRTALALLALAAFAGCGESDDETGTADEDARVLVANQYKPSSEFCPTSQICVKDVEWSVYDTDRAVGVGTGEACEAEGGCNRHPDLSITFTKPERACGAQQFTRVEVFGTIFRLRDAAGCHEYGI